MLGPLRPLGSMAAGMNFKPAATPKVSHIYSCMRAQERRLRLFHRSTC
jgi:hypothetical protein